MWQHVGNKKITCHCVFPGGKGVGYTLRSSLVMLEEELGLICSQLSRVLVSTEETALLVLTCAGPFYPDPFCGRSG